MALQVAFPVEVMVADYPKVFPLGSLYNLKTVVEPKVFPLSNL